MTHSDQLVNEPTNQAELRSYLIDAMRRDLVGPAWQAGSTEPDLAESLSLPKSQPDRFYLTGYLSPIKVISGNTTQSMGSTEEIPPEDVEIPDENARGAQFNNERTTEMDENSGERTFVSPSTMGLTVLPTLSEIKIELDYGTYRNTGDDWQREHHEFTHTLQVEAIDYGETDEIEVAAGVVLHLRRGNHDHPTMTVRIVNRQQQEPGQRRSAAVIFQPRLQVSQDARFKDVRRDEVIFDDKTMSILYHGSTIVALGHNVGVDWNDDGTVANTDFLPNFEIPAMKSIEELDKHVPEMDLLIDEGSFVEGLDCLDRLVDAYDEWVERSSTYLEESLADGLLNAAELTDTVGKHLDDARRNVSRIREGIKFLRTDEIAGKAFRLANAAIKCSQDEPTVSEISERVKENGDFIPFKWYPFQIAFQLLNIRGLCALEREDVGRDDRDIIDLAWFPTAGGKTEAYLGLIATLGYYRRLRFPEKELQPSVHTIMRYTLRLLTSDQADRLVRLMTGMNLVADRFAGQYGVLEHKGKPFPKFRLGMWVGTKVSPNDLLRGRVEYNAQDAIDRLRNDEEEGEGSVIQFEICPWCGNDDETGIRNAANWGIGELNGRPSLRGHCTNPGCELEEWVPYTCVDDDIYLNPPTVLLATADKFVRLADNPWARSLYDEDDAGAREWDARRMLAFGGDADVRPPDLIILDELHLLTGPLGTLAGLLETSMDVAWRDAGHKPKYVAATATIRGAHRDACLMFDREMNVFPPPVATADDNFFAKADYTAGKGRVHIGVLGPPDKARTLLDQPAASLLQRVAEVRERFPDMDPMIIDPYWTLVAYFNSLRELGGAQSSLASRIQEEFIPRFAGATGCQPRELREQRELTSRRTAAQLKEQKASLKKSIREGGVVDTVVTTNMFQVGIDIPRLGLMAIIGQPKSNSEYIQSSGRVGRRTPGLVLSLLRSTFPRDQSHFENYRSFHQEVYRHVDVTSTTPFSVRAMDRALATTLAVLIRMGVRELSTRKDLERVHRSGQLLQSCNRLVDAFREQLVTRQRSTSVPEPIVIEAQETLDAMWQDLLDLTANCYMEGREAWWRVWNIKEAKRAQGWLRSSFIETAGERDSISSLRDVAPEIRAAETWKLDSKMEPGTIPEGHFFSQCTPGGIWEKDGQTFLTLGINLWENGDGDIAFRDEPDGLRVNEDAITTLLEHGMSLRFLPKMEEMGAVAYRRFPGKNGFRCRQGHLSTIRKPDEDKIWRCSRPGCTGDDGLPEKASPSRFVSVCSAGHLAAFNYWGWVHQSGSVCPHNSDIDLHYRDGASFTLASWELECTACGAKRDMQRVPWVTGENGPRCKGWRPWLGENAANEDCEVRMEHRQVGATSVCFNESSGIMLIPLAVSWSLANRKEVAPFVQARTQEAMNQLLEIGTFKQDLERILANTGYIMPDGTINPSFFNAVETYAGLHGDGDGLEKGNLRMREARGLRHADPDARFGERERFDCRPVVGGDIALHEDWKDDAWPIEFVSRADRITQLQYVTGISRIDPTNPTQDIDLPRRGERFGIARYNHGEGIYLEVKPGWLKGMVERRESELTSGHAEMVLSAERFPQDFKDQLPCLVNPGATNALTVLHTFSHLLIRELCRMSGYSLGSISERLYLDVDERGDIRHSGMLLYTSGPSSDGTLGGLVSQGTRKRIKQAVERALATREDCSNDPVCMHHVPIGEERNGAACHTCVLLPETCCELRNFALDRNWC